MPGPRLHSWARIARSILPLLLLATLPCAADQPGAAAILTDRAELTLSNQFSLPPNQFKLTDSGNVFFTTGGNTALFQWNQETATRERLAQTNDPVEQLGLKLAEEPTGYLVDVPARMLQVNAAGHVAFVASAAIKGNLDPAAVFLWDGTSYTFLNPPVAVYSQLLLNNQDKVAIIGSTNPFNINWQSIYIAGAGMDARLIAEQGKTAPGTNGGLFNSFRQLIGFNDSGQLAFVADINGGNTGRGLFLYDGSELRLVAKAGSATGNFNLPVGTPTYGSHYALNNNGKIAFRTGVVGANFTIFVADPAGATTKIAAVGEPVGIADLGNCAQNFWLFGFNDSDRVLYDCNSSTPTGQRHALYLKGPSDEAPRVIVRRGQSFEKLGTLDTTQQASLNNAGNVALLATLTGGSTPMAWLFAPADAGPVKIAGDGEETPAGGVYGIIGRNTPAILNGADQVAFLADLRNASATGLFHWSAGAGVRPVVTSNDDLPEGARTVLRALPAAPSDTEILVRAQKAGGKATWYAAPLDPATASLRAIVSEFDPIPDLGTLVSPDGFSLNAAGEVAFTASLLDAKRYPAAAILLSQPGAAPAKLALSGESVPGGDTLTSFSAPQINNQSQVAFQAGTVSSEGASGQGVFLATMADGMQPVARSGAAMPGGGTFTTFLSVLLNDSGQVAFRGVNSTNGVGIFVGSAGAAPLPVLRNGETIATGIVAGNGSPGFRLNNRGQVAYMSGLSGNGKNSGVFLSTPGENGYTRQTLALNAEVAPVSGDPKYAWLYDDCVELNNAGQVAFWAGLNSDNLTYKGPGNGWFVGTSAADLTPRLMQGQQLPGGGKANMLGPGPRLVALANSGDLAAFLPEVSGSDYQPQLVIAAANGQILPFARSADQAEATESVFGKLYTTPLVTPSGRFLLGAMLLDGPAQAAIFLNKP